MNELALFAGAGGGILGGKLLGWRTICAVELDPYAAGCLVARQNDGCLPAFPIWDDVRTFDGRPWRGRVDVVSGGFPCQRFSRATRGRSTADDLWPDMRRVVSDVSPRIVFAENVSRNTIESAGRDLAGMGYSSCGIPLSAADLGADHIRERFWLYAHTNLHSELRLPINAEMAKLPEFYRGTWSAKPRESRTPNGVAGRVERLVATGNGQVPIVAATAFSLGVEFMKTNLDQPMDTEQTLAITGRASLV